jgi:fatty-acyl-CoA synthase
MTAIPPVDGLTIGAALRRTAAHHPDREALVFLQQGFRATYAQYDQHVDVVARALLALDIRRGDHVAVWATNWPEWVLLFMAASRIGAVLVTVNPAYRTHELAYALRQSDTKALFLIDRFKSSDYFAMAGEVRQEVPDLRWLISMKDHAPRGMLTWPQFMGIGDTVLPGELRAREAELSPADPINLQYTSGTTGFPKGVLLTHRSVLLNAWYVGQSQGLEPEDRVCVPVPFYHCFGVVIGVLGCAVRGATMMVPDEYFSPEEVLDCVERERATSIYGVPTMFVAALEHESFPGRDMSSLRTGIMAGSPCPVEVMNRVVTDMGARGVTIAYGLTEASPAITQTRADDPVEVRVKTVGRPLPGVEVRIVDPGSGDVLGDGQQGELQARGHNVMLGYYGMPEETAEAIGEDGWLHTGDLALRESDGNYRITGRIKDMIIRGGENVYPREIEEFLYAHPAVESAQVVGVPDPRFGEEVCVWIRTRPGVECSAEEIRAFCRERLAYFKVPRYVMFVDEFPLTVTGKVQKFKIRQEAIRKLGLEVREEGPGFDDEAPDDEALELAEVTS